MRTKDLGVMWESLQNLDRLVTKCDRTKEPVKITKILKYMSSKKVNRTKYVEKEHEENVSLLLMSYVLFNHLAGHSLQINLR